MIKLTKTCKVMAAAITCTVVLLAQVSIAQINTPSGATIPFGSNTSYSYGIMPTNLPSGGSYGASNDAATAYNSWKSRFVVDCSGGSKRVLFDDNSSTVSEGIAYGMLLAAYAADKATFDGLWKFYKDNRNSRGVMNWKINGCSGASGQNGATDAELDAAMALIIAEYQWPTATSPYNYQNEAATLIAAIRQYEIHPSSYQTINGDAWGFGNNCRNPSYFSPAYYREYAAIETNQASFWNSTVSASNSFLLTNRNSSTGLVSNWADQNASPNSCNGPNEYGYDACRNPWRMANDVLWNGASKATTASDICNKIAAWSNGNANNLKGPLSQNASSPNSGQHKNGAFSTYALAIMGTSSTYQNHLNACYTAVVGLGNNELYFSATLRAISLFMLTGNFWKPGTTGTPTNQAPTVSLTSPTNNTSFCLGENITISASASDADGSISKVEFYNGNTLLGTDNSSPYSYTWTNASAGSKTISAIAYDNNNASTTSSSRTITVNSTNAPTVTSPINYCRNETASPLTASGQNLKWYTSSTGGGGSSTAPTPNTGNTGQTSYWVSQTVNGCEGPRAEIVVSVGNATSTPTVSSPVNVCEGGSITLTATGNNLKWYTSSSGGTGTTNPPNVNTSNPNTLYYYVSQTMNGCESPRAQIQVNVLDGPNAPSADTPLTYKLNDPATPLSASGTNLKWYNTATGGSGSSTAPTPSTSTEGTRSYYVSQTNNSGCESPRTQIVVTVTDALVINRTTTAPIIDGNIDAVWSNATGGNLTNLIQGSVSNANDLSGSFKALWDNNYFYVLGEIKDDDLSRDSGPVYQDDGIEIYFDFGNDKAGTYSSNDFQYTFRWNDAAISVNPGANSSSGVNFSMIQATGGYVFEVRIPWSTLGGSPQPGDLHGFDFHANDDDMGGDRDGKLSWKATVDDAWQNTSLFGTIILGDMITSIDKIGTTGLAVYPNPFSTTLNIKGLKEETSYTIVDMNGKAVQTGSTNGQITPELVDGIYLLKLEGYSYMRIIKVN